MRYGHHILKYSLVGLSTGASIYYLHKNDYSFSHIGVVRFARVGLVACHTMLDYKWTLLGLDVDSSIYNEKIQKCHQRGAERLLALARRNGGVFIKVGQHIASLQYLLPEPYTTTLSVLHSNAPESSFEEIKSVFEKSTLKNIDEVFDEFDPMPCGAASLAQVHKARLKSTGEYVAVKIQHPHVRSRSVVDMVTMELFVRIAAFVFPNLRLNWLVNEMKRNLPIELDFVYEASNADRVRQMFSHLSFLKIPKIYYEYSNDLVLTMEFCEGGKINDLEYFKTNRISRHKVCRMLGKLYSEMIFKDGYVHADPHPGNILIRLKPNGNEEIILLDHGLYVFKKIIQTLPDDLRIDYAQLWLAILRADKEEIQKISKRMNVGSQYGLLACVVSMRSWDAVSKGIITTKRNEQEAKRVQNFAASLIPQISLLLDSLPRQMLLLLKTNDLLRSIAFRLKAENNLDSFTEMSKHCIQAVYFHSINKSQFLFERLNLRLKMFSLLIGVSLYEFYLFITCLFLKT
ncbi:ABC1 domain-containing protein [Meloidogyne graminicola]|uniref:ABC1 domain-containing protein n=1 Tax=Meloidogyne graminicola TaxID=189291 RepID=A0A8S9ZD05_9BILA|nr:ABC1 domain-containing protein [Meloidogyne graminicola]